MIVTNRKRNKSIGIRVTEQEYVRIKKKVEISKLSLREYVLRCLFNKEIHVKEGGLEVVKELKRIGNNLNQITHKVNTGELRDCSDQLNNIYYDLRELMMIWQ